MADDINQLRDKLREALWGNEAFTIGILQTVAGGAIFGIFSLGDERSGWAELLAAIVITLLGAALLWAVLDSLARTVADTMMLPVVGGMLLVNVLLPVVRAGRFSRGGEATSAD